MARRLSSLLGCRLQYPTLKPRFSLLNHPEIVLVALLVVASKLCLPFEHVTSLASRSEKPPSLKFDWRQWSDARSRPTHEKTTFDNVTAEEVAAMDEKELDAYFSHVSSFISQKSEALEAAPSKKSATALILLPDEKPIAAFFPSQPDPEPQLPVPEVSEEAVDQKLRQTLQQAMGDGVAGVWVPSRTYDAFRTYADVPEVIKGLYDAAGKCRQHIS